MSESEFVGAILYGCPYLEFSEIRRILVYLTLYTTNHVVIFDFILLLIV